MSTFFDGWRRKAGCVLLVLACVFMAGWIRSRMIGDAIMFPVGRRQNAIVALNGTVHWWAVTNGPADWGFDSSDRPVDELTDEIHELQIQLEPFQFRDWCVSYWSITVPLTLLSAYLILWKPRKPSPNTTTLDRQ